MPYLIPICLLLEYCLILAYTKILVGSTLATQTNTLASLMVPAFWQNMNSQELTETENGCFSKLGNKLKVKGVPIHDGLLYLLTGVLIYLPIGIAMRFLVEDANDEWYMVYLMSAYLGGFLLYLLFATLFYRLGHELKFLITRARDNKKQVRYDWKKQ